MQYWFHGLGYEEGFSPGNVPPTEVRKKHVDTHVILSAVTLKEMREIFSEVEFSCFFFYMHGCILYIAWTK